VVVKLLFKVVNYQVVELLKKQLKVILLTCWFPSVYLFNRYSLL